MAYDFDHQQEIDAEVRSEWEQVARERAASGTRSPLSVAPLVNMCAIWN